jgi:hypothetical protein
MSAMSAEVPQIRVHRYEPILAVKWPACEHWLMVRPDLYPEFASDGKPAADTHWNTMVTDAAHFDQHEWIDPAADHHRDLTRLTGAIRDDLAQTMRQVTRTLDTIDRHPY